MIDYSRQQVWWAQWPALNAVLHRSRDRRDAVEPADLMIGGSDGYVRKTDVANRAIDDPRRHQRARRYALHELRQRHRHEDARQCQRRPRAEGRLHGDLRWTRDDNAQQTTTVTQGGGDVLGVASAHQFTLDSSALAGAQFVDRFFEAEEGGEFRSIGYSITNAGLNEDLEVHSFAGIEIGAQSTQTTLS
jgi:hypothetical protein